MKLLAKNKKAFHDYEIIKKFVVGIALTGSEVKAIRNGQANLRDSFIRIVNEEAFIWNMSVSKYKFSTEKDYDPYRTRKLLLHKKQIHELMGAIEQRGLTVVPLAIFIQNNKIKVEIAIVRGLKKYDKREKEKKRVIKRKIDRAKRLTMV